MGAERHTRWEELKIVNEGINNAFYIFTMGVVLLVFFGLGVVGIRTYHLYGESDEVYRIIDLEDTIKVLEKELIVNSITSQIASNSINMSEDIKNTYNKRISGIVILLESLELELSEIEKSEEIIDFREKEEKLDKIGYYGMWGSIIFLIIPGFLFMVWFLRKRRKILKRGNIILKWEATD
jgi:hypothetical protein